MIPCAPYLPQSSVAVDPASHPLQRVRSVVHAFSDMHLLTVGNDLARLRIITEKLRATLRFDYPMMSIPATDVDFHPTVLWRKIVGNKDNKKEKQNDDNKNNDRDENKHNSNEWFVINPNGARRMSAYSQINSDGEIVYGLETDDNSTARTQEEEDEQKQPLSRAGVLIRLNRKKHPSLDQLEMYEIASNGVSVRSIVSSRGVVEVAGAAFGVVNPIPRFADRMNKSLWQRHFKQYRFSVEQHQRLPQSFVTSGVIAGKSSPWCVAQQHTNVFILASMMLAFDVSPRQHFWFDVGMWLNRVGPKGSFPFVQATFCRRRDKRSEEENGNDDNKNNNRDDQNTTSRRRPLASGRSTFYGENKWAPYAECHLYHVGYCNSEFHVATISKLTDRVTFAFSVQNALQRFHKAPTRRAVLEIELPPLSVEGGWWRALLFADPEKTKRTALTVTMNLNFQDKLEYGLRFKL